MGYKKVLNKLADDLITLQKLSNHPSGVMIGTVTLKGIFCSYYGHPMGEFDFEINYPAEEFKKLIDFMRSKMKGRTKSLGKHVAECDKRNRSEKRKQAAKLAKDRRNALGV